nr:hypothetical protein [Tanacetum cinerariifolium]
MEILLEPTSNKLFIEKSVHESEHVMPMDVKESNLDNVTNDADEKQVDDIPMIPKNEWFKQSPRPETLDPDSNMVKTVDDAPEQSWFNKMIQAEKPPLTFDELMSTPIDFAAFDQLDSTNPEGHKRPVDMSKPLPLQDKEGQLIIPLEFFFNNNLEYLKAKSLKRRYSSSITKTPAARYTLEIIEDMIPTLWSLFTNAYDKDVALGISHWGPQR